MQGLKLLLYELFWPWKIDFCCKVVKGYDGFGIGEFMDIYL
jgi:hypothetical protein